MDHTVIRTLETNNKQVVVGTKKIPKFYALVTSSPGLKSKVQPY